MKIKEVIRKKQNRLKKSLLGVLGSKRCHCFPVPPDGHGFRGK